MVPGGISHLGRASAQDGAGEVACCSNFARSRLKGRRRASWSRFFYPLLAGRRASHMRACAAPQRTCADVPRYGWNWTVPPARNLHASSAPGLRIVRGIDVVRENDVQILSSFKQSNWPALNRAGHGVRATSQAQRERMCRLWRHTSTLYQSWPILLGCPGWRDLDFASGEESECTTRTAVFGVECAYVEFASHEEQQRGRVPGSLYDAKRWYQLDQSRWPPNVCAQQSVERVPDFATSLGVNPRQVGHWLSEQLPHVLLLYDTVPKHVPVLVADSPVSRRYLGALFANGALRAERIWLAPSEWLANRTLHAEHVYAVAHSRFYYVTAGDYTVRRARDAFVRTAAWRRLLPPLPFLSGFGAPSSVLVMDRGLSLRLDSRGKLQQERNDLAPRAFLPSADVYHTLREAIQTSATAKWFSVTPWSPSPYGIADDLAQFHRAALIVSPHGANLANIIFAPAGTPIIEICYDNNGSAVLPGVNFPRFFECPPTLAMLGLNLRLPYWLLLASGTISSPLRVDSTQLRQAVTQAIAHIPPLSVAPPPAPSSTECDSGAAAHPKPRTRVKWEEPRAKKETLVILLGSVRGGERAWRSLDQNLLSPNHADLALMIGVMPGAKPTLLHRLAKYVWTVPERDNWGDAVDEIRGRMKLNMTVWRQWRTDLLKEGNPNVTMK